VNCRSWDHIAPPGAALSLTQGLRGELAPQGSTSQARYPARSTADDRWLSIPKMTPAEAATEILDGYESGEEDIYVVKWRAASPRSCPRSEGG